MSKVDTTPVSFGGIFRAAALRCLLFLLPLVLLSAQERILLAPPSIYPDSPDARSYFSNLYDETIFLYGELYGDEGSLVLNGRSTLRVHINAVSSSGSNVVQIHSERLPGGEQSPTTSILQDYRSLSPQYLARIIRYQQEALDGFSPPDDNPAPLLLDAFGLEYFDLRAARVSYMIPYSAAARSNGNMVLAVGDVALEFNALNFAMESIIGSSLVDGNRHNEMYDIEISPSDVLYSRPVTGRFINRFIPGSKNPERVNSPVQQPLAFAVSADGSLFLSESSRAAVMRIQGRQTSQVPMATNEYLSPMAMAGGPNNSVWVFDLYSGFVNVYSPSGELIELIMPFMPQEEASMVRHLLPARDGSFLLLSTETLYRFDRQGRMLWRQQGIPDSQGGNFMYATGLAFSEVTGEILIPLSSAGIILRLYDKNYAMRNGLDPGERMILASLQQELIEDPSQSSTLTRIAEFHRERGAIQLARYYYEQASMYEQGLDSIHTAITALRITELRGQASMMYQEVVDIINSLGPESARSRYQTAIQLYEEMIYLDPENRDTVIEKMRLEELFQRALAVPRNLKPLEVLNVQLPDIFPSLISAYAENPWGRIELHNPLESAAEDILVEFFIPHYMDFPTQIENPGPLAPGESIEMDLKPVFSRTILQLEEEIPVMASLNVIHHQGGDQFELRRTYQIRIQGQNSLSWDDSRKLASFITPNEAVIRDFTLTLLAAGMQEEQEEQRDNGTGTQFLGARFARAAALLNGLGLYGISYVEDPERPITDILGRPDVVDTVRYPRTTLYYQSGDCDDTTALSLSLLEAAGIPTAILTSPGHVFGAFNSGIPAENAWLLESASTSVLPFNGQLWIPFETTNLDQGLMASWEEASRLVVRHQGSGDFEFLPVREAGVLYPPIPLESANFTVIPPSPGSVQEFIRAESSLLREELYLARIQDYENSSESLSGRRRVRELNRLGALHLFFREYGKAEETLLTAAREDRANTQAWLYLANLYLALGKGVEALQAVEEGLARSPESAWLLAAKSMSLHTLGRTDEAGELVERLSRIEPELANRLGLEMGLEMGLETELAEQVGNQEGGVGGNRASSAASPFSLILPPEDDGAR